MTIALALAAVLGSTGNPLLGTWVIDGHAPSPRSTMTITPLAMSFGSGTRALGSIPISAFEKQDRLLSIRTRFGDLYRFRFDRTDHICRVPDSGLQPTQCFARSTI